MTDDITPPPRPKRAEFETDAEYRRAYGRWNDKYNPKRIATNAARCRASYAKNKEKRLAAKRVYYAEHQAERDAYSREYRRNRYADDPEFRAREQERSKGVMAARRAACPELVREINRRWAESHKPEIAVANKAWRQRTGYDTGPERAAYREANREEIAARQRVWYGENKEKANETTRKWKEANYERFAQMQREYRENNKEKLDAYRKEHYKNNKPRYLQHNRLREANLKQARPPWLTKEQQEQIDEIYVMAELLTQDTGIDHVVDHIWPLKGRTSCGLHVPWNLRVISRLENSRKKNRDPEES